MFSLCSLVLCNNRSNAVFVIASQSGMLRARMCVLLAYSVANFGAIFEIELVLVAGYEFSIVLHEYKNEVNFIVHNVNFGNLSWHHCLPVY